ncbi:MAG: type II toxin-antitoxin system VapB family antitoxin [Acidobacteriota bacterium]
MKTTVEIPDPLLAAARGLADEAGVTLRALIEEGLRRLIDERGRLAEFHLRRASFGGQGLQPDAAEWGWEKIRALAYEGRGA